MLKHRKNDISLLGELICEGFKVGVETKMKENKKEVNK